MTDDLLSNVYTYPNPAKGDRLTFKYRVGDNADVTVDVYNLAGERVTHLEKYNNPGFQDLVATAKHNAWN